MLLLLQWRRDYDSGFNYVIPRVSILAVCITTILYTCLKQDKEMEWWLSITFLDANFHHTISTAV